MQMDWYGSGVQITSWRENKKRSIWCVYFASALGIWDTALCYIDEYLHEVIYENTFSSIYFHI